MVNNYFSFISTDGPAHLITTTNQSRNDGEVKSFVEREETGYQVICSGEEDQEYYLIMQPRLGPSRAEDICSMIKYNSIS